MEGMETAADVTPDTSVEPVDAASNDNQEHGHEKRDGQGEAQAKKSSKKPLTDEEYEEIALGSVKGKVPKHLAKAIKDYERGVQSKFQEVSQVRKQAENLMSFARENPREFFKQLKIDPYEFAEATLSEKLELMQMTPEQKKLQETEQKLKKYQDQEELTKKEHEERKKTHEMSQAQQSLDKEIAEAFMESKLPKKKFYVQQLAASMLSAEKRGEQLSAKEAAARVREGFKSDAREVFSDMSIDDLREVLGDQILKKLREADVRRVTENTAPTLKSPARPGGSAPVTNSTQGSKKPLSEKEWKAWHNSLRNGS